MLRMKKIISALIFLLSLTSAQQQGTLSGFVRDKANGESLPFANVYIKYLKLGTATNIEGYYAIPNIPEGE